MKRVICLVFCSLCLCICAVIAHAETRYIIAAIDAGDAGKVHLREGPSTDAASLGLYFTGTELFCDSDPTQEWTKVVIGSQDGYIKSEYLCWGDAMGSVQSRQPLGVVRTDGWVNVRNTPYVNAQLEGKLYDGDVVTIYGETATHWYYGSSNGLLGYIKADYVSIAEGGGTTGGGNIPPSPQNVTQKVDPQDSLDAYVIASNCCVNLIPTDDSFVTCQYDAGALSFTHSIARGTHMLTLEGKGSSSASESAAATLYIPKSFYHQIYLHVKHGEGSVAGGFECYSIVHGDNARFSLTLASDSVYGYTIGLIHSDCVMGISEVAENYAISVERISNSTISVPTYSMPPYQPGDSSYFYTTGTGAAQIKVDSVQNSNLSIAFVRW